MTVITLTTLTTLIDLAACGVLLHAAVLRALTRDPAAHPAVVVTVARHGRARR